MVWINSKSTCPYIYQYQHTTGYKENALLLLKIFKIIKFKTGVDKKQIDQQHSLSYNCHLNYWAIMSDINGVWRQNFSIMMYTDNVSSKTFK